MKAKSFTEKRKLKTDSENCEVNCELTMKKRRKNRAGKYSINEEVNVADSEDFIITIIQNGQTIMDVECGTNKAKLTLEKLWQGSKGQCVEFQGSWLTPNEFQYVSGRETAKDWKRSIRHQGKSIKLLLSKGYLKVTADGVDEAKEKQTSDGRKKKRGKGSRRGKKPKSTDVQTPVLVDLQGSLNGVQLPENNIDDNLEISKLSDGTFKNNQSESNDDSHDGNETDETIENYYSENEYLFAKENDLNNINKQKSATRNHLNGDIENETNNGTDYNQNVETETEDDIEEHISAEVVTDDKSSLGSHNSKNNSEPEKSFTESDDDIDDYVKETPSPMNIENTQSSSETAKQQTQRLPQRNSEEPSEQYEGAQTSMSQGFEASHRHDSSADNDKLANVPIGDPENDDKDGSGNAIDTGYTNSDTEVLNDSMPSIVDDVANTRPNALTSYEFEQQTMKTDSPPTLIPQKSTDYYLPKPEVDGNNECLTADDDLNSVKSDGGEPKVFKNPNKLILSLPIKNTSFMQSNSDKWQEAEKKEDTLNNDKTETKKDIVSSNLSSVKMSKGKRNKRKRSPKHVNRIDKVEHILNEKHIPAIETHVMCDSKNTNTECRPKLESNMQDKIDQNDVSSHKYQLDDIQKPMEHVHDSKRIHLSLTSSNSSKNGHTKAETIARKSSTERSGLNVQSCVTQSDKVAKFKEETSIPTTKVLSTDNKNPFINLSSTVPRINGDMNQRKSPLQNSYDEYMRRLEASRYAASWNPFFPYFQSGRHCNSMTPPISPFMAPYPPLLGSTGSPKKDSFPDSLKTPMSSPLQSPYTATPPPSFEIPRLSSFPSVWNDQGSSSVANCQLVSNYKTKTSSSDNPSSCLTIKPAHSVKPESLCSGSVKRASMDSSSPLDLSVKKIKTESSNLYSDYMGFRKHKDSNNSQYQNTSSEMVLAKKHKKLKRVWINGTESVKQKQYTTDKCTCFRENIENWSVDQVYNFVRRLDGCSLYSEKFKEHNISGGTLQLLNTDHLIRGLGMKVGPAIVLCDAVRQEVHNSSRRPSSCLHCRSRSLRDDHKLFS